jgi:hypothetical protein
VNPVADRDPDVVLERLREGLRLDRETEREVLEEIRSHLEDAAAVRRSSGLDEGEAWAEAAERFGAVETALELQRIHAGWGTVQVVVACGLPVVLALLLRWLVLDPGGTASGWLQTMTKPALWGTAVVLFLASLRICTRWRYAMAAWIVFWTITVLSFLGPVHRW